MCLEEGFNTSKTAVIEFPSLAISLHKISYKCHAKEGTDEEVISEEEARQGILRRASMALIFRNKTEMLT